MNVPYAADYEGVFDLYYKLPALKNQGVKIHLHCFDHGRGEQAILNEFCETVHYYKRKKGLTGLSVKYPCIVSSLANKVLLNRLAQDDHPILMEGVHCTHLLNDKRFANRRCFVRLHNVEHVYYRHLYQFTHSFLKKSYYYFKSKLLRHYEKRIAGKATFWAVIEKDVETYKKLEAKNIEFLPLFIPFREANLIAGSGSFCLYHGDLSVAENEKAATWLIREVFANLNMPFVIAGKKPSKKLQRLVHAKTTTCLIADPDNKEMQDLITKAHINIIPSYNSTGIKLKLINALFNGKHCLVNEATVEGSGLKDFCYIADDASSFRRAIKELYEQPFEQQEIYSRLKFLHSIFDNEKNAGKIVKWIWGE